MTLFSLGSLYIGTACAADCCIYRSDHAWVVHLWIVRLELDCVRLEELGSAQKNYDQSGHGSSGKSHELITNAR
jgi:hypothetical protein